jgi:hypothetical protein
VCVWKVAHIDKERVAVSRESTLDGNLQRREKQAHQHCRALNMLGR